MVELIAREGAVLIELAARPAPTVTQIADRLHLSTRTVRRHISALEKDGVVSRVRVGNRNRYEIHRDAPAGKLLAGHTAGDFLRRFDR